MLPLQRGERCLHPVVLVKLGLDVIVDVLQFFLQVLNQLAQRSIGSVPDFVPLEGAKILIRGLYGQPLDMRST